jgi:hypothetical protein
MIAKAMTWGTAQVVLMGDEFNLSENNATGILVRAEVSGKTEVNGHIVSFRASRNSFSITPAN